MRVNKFSIFKYRGKDRRIFKKSKGYLGFVDEHHVIPQQHKNHFVLKKIKYDMNSNFNLFIMPNSKAKNYINLHPDTLIHRNHPKYNKFVKLNLDMINKKCRTNDEIEYNIWLFVNFLKDNLVFNKENIPW